MINTISFSSSRLSFLSSIPFLLFLKYDEYLEMNTIIQSKVPKFLQPWNLETVLKKKISLENFQRRERERKRRTITLCKIICVKYLLWNFRLYTTVTNVVAPLREINKNRAIKRIRFMLLWCLSQLPWWNYWNGNDK